MRAASTLGCNTVVKGARRPIAEAERETRTFVFVVSEIFGSANVADYPAAIWRPWQVGRICYYQQVQP